MQREGNERKLKRRRKEGQKERKNKQNTKQNSMQKDRTTVTSYSMITISTIIYKGGRENKEHQTKREDHNTHLRKQNKQLGEKKQKKNRELGKTKTGKGK